MKLNCVASADSLFFFKDCTEVSFCNGRTALCPPAATKSDNVTECNGGTQVSYQLSCSHECMSTSAMLQMFQMRNCAGVSAG